MATEEQNASEVTDLKDLCREMFDKITHYLNGELTGNAYSEWCDELICFSVLSHPATSEEYKLLQQLNQITLAKYTDMCSIAHRLNEVSTRVNDNCKLIDVQSAINIIPPILVCIWYTLL